MNEDLDIEIGDDVIVVRPESSTHSARMLDYSPNLQNIPVRTEAGREIRSAFSLGIRDIDLSHLPDADVFNLFRLLIEGSMTPEDIEIRDEDIEIGDDVIIVRPESSSHPEASFQQLAEAMLEASAPAAAPWLPNFVFSDGLSSKAKKRIRQADATKCVKCGAPIPPGKPGRKCKGCRQ